MLDRARVTVWLHRLICHEEFERIIKHPAGFLVGTQVGSDPYLWPVLFAIDGRDTLIRSPDDLEGSAGDLVLGGRPSIQTTRGGPDNMGAHGFSLKAGDQARVPGDTGYFSRESPAIRLPFPCDPLRPEGVLGTVGLVVGLFDHDDLPHDSIRKGYDTFAASLRTEIGDIIDGTPIRDAGNLSQEQLDGISARIAANVKATIMASLSTGELLSFGLGFSDKDDEIGSTLFTFDLPGLVADVARVETQEILKTVTLPKAGGGQIDVRHRWDVEVIAIATRMPPAQAIADVAGMHGVTIAEEIVAAAGAAPSSGGPWGALTGRFLSPLLAAMVLDPGLAEPAAAMLDDVGSFVRDPDTVATPGMVDRVDRLLEAAGDLGGHGARVATGRQRRIARGLRGSPVSRLPAI